MDKLGPLFFLAMLFVNVHKDFCQQNFVKHSIKAEEHYTTKNKEAITSQWKTNGEVQTRSLYTLLTNAQFQHYRIKLQKHRKVRQLSDTSRTKKIRRSERAKLIKQGNQCLQWEPILNITTVPEVRNLMMDYCSSESTVIPNTIACFGTDYSEYCVEIKTPSCGYTFENVSTGNYTIRIQARCDVCYDSIMFNEECLTPIFENEQFIVIESATLDEPEKSGTPQKDDHARVDIIAGCTAAGFGCVVLTVVVVARIKKICVPPTDPSDPSESIEMTVMIPPPASNPPTSPDVNSTVPLPTAVPSTSQDMNIMVSRPASNPPTSPGVNSTVPPPTAASNNDQYSLGVYFQNFLQVEQSPPGPLCTLDFDIPYALIQNVCDSRYGHRCSCQFSDYKGEAQQ